jgi:hypothetical protein
MLERINQELKRRTLVVRIFPNATSCLRLIRGAHGGDSRRLGGSDTVPGHGGVEGTIERAAAGAGTGGLNLKAGRVGKL